ncbi:integrase [Parvularcula dongshanensis]|uniref:Integrase n=1 Tax=Parvularcula dongshanensis TaxID=1173995 RepID=A0A840HYK4_9PROT|nr:integrase [Parvularcula dongshanensis]
MRCPHRVPLRTPTPYLLAQLRELTGLGELLFQSLRSPCRPVSENSLNAALRCMGYRREQMTAHGFRAPFSTLANENFGDDSRS